MSGPEWVTNHCSLLHPQFCSTGVFLHGGLWCCQEPVCLQTGPASSMHWVRTRENAPLASASFTKVSFFTLTLGFNSHIRSSLLPKDPLFSFSSPLITTFQYLDNKSCGSSISGAHHSAIFLKIPWVCFIFFNLFCHITIYNLCFLFCCWWWILFFFFLTFLTFLVLCIHWFC